MDREFLEVEDMLVRLFRTVTESEGVQELSAAIPYYYGCQFTVGPDGRQHIKEFGNARPLANELVNQTNVRHPIVDTNLNKKENVLIVTVETPGITKQDLKVELEDGLIIIHAEKGGKKYHIEVPINSELEPDSAKASYINGILELKINLKKAPKSSVKEVRVE
jgi:HSP20 family protein